MLIRSRMLVAMGVVAILLVATGCATDESGDVEGGEETAAEETAAATEDAAATEEDTAAAEEGGSITIGSTNFSEQLILAAMYELLLEAEGVEVETRPNLGNREVVFPALEQGEIDLLPEYTGSLAAFLSEEGAEEPGQDSEEVYQRLTDALPEGIVALEPSEAQDANAFAVTEQFAEENGVASLSDLADVEGTVTVGGPPELETRFDGIPGLQEVYGLENVEFVPLDAGGPLTLSALEGGQVQVGRVFTTQGTLDGRGLVVLEDDQNLVPAENLVPIAREDAVTDTVEETLNELSATITEEDLIELNRRVDVDAEDPETVAEEWLTENGLLEG